MATVEELEVIFISSVLARMLDSLLQGPRKDLGGVELFDSCQGGLHLTDL